MVFIPRETYRHHPLWHCSLWGPLSLWCAESLTSTENRGNKLPFSSIIELWDTCLVFISSGYVLIWHIDVVVSCLDFSFWLAHLSWPWTQYVVKNDPELLLTLLPPLPECQDYRCVPPHLFVYCSGEDWSQSFVYAKQLCSMQEALGLIPGTKLNQSTNQSNKQTKTQQGLGTSTKAEHLLSI